MALKRLWPVLILAAAVGGAIWAWWKPGPDDVDPPAADPWFVDVSDEVGLDFVHDAGPVGDYFMPQQVGSGAAFLDFDNDNRLDIYLLQNGGPRSTSTNRLYRQLPSGKFQDVSKGSGLDINGHNMGVAIGDVNNDGWPDVLVTQYTGVKLFLNQKNGTFRDVTEQAKLSNPSWGTSAAFFDYDRDGWLDLVIVCYVDYDPTWPCGGTTRKKDFCAPKNFKGRVSRLFHNRGFAAAAEKTPVLFEDVTVPSGLGRLPGPGLGVLCADLDGDGWQDIFIANDGEPNRLWINRQGTFVEEALVRGIAYDGRSRAMAGMGIAFGDADGDGLPDLFVTHLTEENQTLWRQNPRGLFLDWTTRTGLLEARRSTGFGTVFGDFDNDGDLDLAIVNGRVYAGSDPGDGSLGPFWSYYGERNLLLANDGKGQFRDVSSDNAAFCGAMNMGRGLARGDFDRDGALDLLVTTIAGRARLLRNVARKQQKEPGHWLSIRAIDGKRDALGTELSLHAAGRQWFHWLHPAESYLCSSEPRAHVGLGSVTKVDHIDVRWPDGARERFERTHKGVPGIPVDQRIELRKGEGRVISP